MAKIEFPPEQKARLVAKLQSYLDRELEVELGQFDAEFMLDFLGREFGAYFYNQGLQDAQAMMLSRLETVSEAIWELEQPLG
ncbi:DUF2164 domain-containing protein [Shewanella sedimentimangrovi]|uniref:DUF2164 domain-containing protein n=1 Tax=Shewanella sedimentimangrovi TaxID=2814293 RepID=A0ABX7QXQ6_9GAMM|nr:DUF2164 domain-containing protein [Shewanella sedimentimangrovi]QSX36303.1 DUF2164 domain-containing protein [Shewanella sedimentimangrovi]